MRRGKVIILHKRDLVASQWSPGQILGNSGCELPERKRHRKKFRSRANVQRDCPQKLLVGVDLRTTKFIVGPGGTEGIQQYARYSLPNIFHIDGLQPRLT